MKQPIAPPAHPTPADLLAAISELMLALTQFEAAQAEFSARLDVVEAELKRRGIEIPEDGRNRTD